jgi:hypothetical protein
MRIMLRCCRIAALSCLLLSLSIFGFGQNQPHRGKVNVPFEFSIGGVTFPAGQYTLEAISPSYGLLRSNDGKRQQALYFVQKKSAPAKTPEVIFGKRFNKYYLAGIWGWFGWLQFTGFSPHEGDETKEVPITQAE